MQPRVSIVTLGVSNVSRATAFYEALGFRRSSASQESVTFMQLGPLVLGLFGREDLKADAAAESVWSGNGGITLAHNVASPEEVETILQDAAANGATILKPAQKAFWGGYHGYFADLDGHVWEIAHNPSFETRRRARSCCRNSSGSRAASRGS